MRTKCTRLALSILFVTSARSSVADVLLVPSEYATIQAAVTAAVDGDEVRVAPGTYMGNGNDDIQFMGKDIALRSEGGPAVTEILVQGQDRGVLFQGGETSAAVLDGFTIRDGWALDRNGGGIFIDGASPTIENCIIVSCTANDGEHTVGGRGGGIYCGPNSAPVIRNCTLTENTVFEGSGGAISCVGANVLIEDCAIVGNVSTNLDTSGGGIAASAGSQLIVRRCRIQGNATGSNSAISTYQASIELEDCIITGNSCRLGVEVAAVGIWGTAAMRRCTVSGNRASYGGGLKVYAAGVVELIDSIVWGNCPLEDPNGVEGYIEGELVIECSDIDLSRYQVDGTITLAGPQIASDPQFCEPIACVADPVVGGDYHLCASSPCLAGNGPPECGLMGALGEACEGNCTPVAVVARSWGDIKVGFRKE